MIKTKKPLSKKDYLYISLITLAIIACIPLIAAFGAIMQICFVLIMPIMIVFATIQAFSKPKTI